jgi:hypothetical protein
VYSEFERAGWQVPREWHRSGWRRKDCVICSCVDEGDYSLGQPAYRSGGVVAELFAGLATALGDRRVLSGTCAVTRRLGQHRHEVFDGVGEHRVVGALRKVRLHRGQCAGGVAYEASNVPLPKGGDRPLVSPYPLDQITERSRSGGERRSAVGICHVGSISRVHAIAPYLNLPPRERPLSTRRRGPLRRIRRVAEGADAGYRAPNRRSGARLAGAPTRRQGTLRPEVVPQASYTLDVRFRGSATSVLVATAVVAAGAAAFASQSGPRSPLSHSQVERPLGTRVDGLLSWDHVPQPAVFTAGTGLYLAWVTSSLPLGRAPVHEELARVDAGSGEVTAEAGVHGQVASVLTDGGSLLALVTSRGEELLRLDRATLAETGHWRIGGAQVPGSEASAMARAGGGVWIATGPELVHYTPRRSRITLRVPIPNALNADLATTATGSVLLVGEATKGGVGHIQRRNTVTGQLMAESSPVLGVVDPFLTAVTGNNFWVSEATGMMGHVQQFSLTPLAPVGTCRTGIRTQTCIFGTNGITARLSSGRLFVNQPAGGRTLNFCATPNGHVLSPLPVPTSDGVLTVGRGVLFLFVPSAKYDTSVKELRIPQACEAG